MTEEKTTPYRVKGTNIRHNRKTHPPGGVIHLTDEEAARLRAFLEPQGDFGDTGDRTDAFENALKAAAEEIERLRADLAAKESDLEKLGTTLNQALEVNAVLKDQVAESDATITGLNARIAELESKPADKGGKK